MILHTPEDVAFHERHGAWCNQTLSALLAQRVQAQGSAPAVLDPPNKSDWTGQPPQRLDWLQLHALVARLALSLHDRGLRRDDVVLAQLPNIVEFVALHLACARLGVVISPLHIQQGAHDLQRCAAIAAAKGWITLRRIGKRDQCALAQSVQAGQDDPLAVHWLEDLLAARPAQTLEEVEARLERIGLEAPVTPNDIHTICWTSGTEGDPKGVPRSHNNWVAVAQRIIAGASLRPGDVLLNPFPLVAVGGLSVFMPWLFQGGTLVLHQPTDLALLLQQIRQEAVNYVCIAPALLNRLLLEPELANQDELATLRVIGSGSGPIDAWTIAGFRDRYGVEIVNFYGSNEGAGFIADARRLPDPAQRAVLFPAEGRGDAGPLRTRLLDRDTRTEVDAPGVEGELAVRGPAVFPGYYRQGTTDRRAFTSDGFFLTGDTFRLETLPGDPAALYYRFVGRYKDIVIRGGMKISPEELDGLLVGHPRLLEAACCGVPDAVMGEKVGVVVVPRPGASVDLPDICDWLRTAGVTTYKLPEAMVQIDRLPRSALNKVLRRELPPLFRDGAVVA